MGRRFLERFQKRVEGTLREHVNFVDDVDLEPRRHRRVAHRLDDLADVVDPGVARGVHFDDVDMPALGNCPARLANPARIDRRPARSVWPNAVERLCNQPCRRGLADPAHSSQQKPVRDPARRDRVAERPNHRLLPDQLGKALRPIFACQHPIRRSRRRLLERLGGKIEAQAGLLGQRFGRGIGHGPGDIRDGLARCRRGDLGIPASVGGKNTATADILRENGGKSGGV